MKITVMGYYVVISLEAMHVALSGNGTVISHEEILLQCYQLLERYLVLA